MAYPPRIARFRAANELGAAKTIKAEAPITAMRVVFVVAFIRSRATATVIEAHKH